MQNFNLEEYLNHLSSGKVSALNAYNYLSNCNYNVGLKTNYFQEKWVNSSTIENRKSKGTLVFAEGDDQFFNNKYILVRNSLKYEFSKDKESLINFYDVQHFYRLFKDLNENNIEVDTIIVQCNNSYDNINDSIKANVIKAYNIVKAVTKLKQNTPFLCLWIYKNRSLESCFNKAIKGFAKTAFEETQNIIIRTIYIDEKNTNHNTSLDHIIDAEKLDFSAEFEVKYSQNGRMVKRFYLKEQLEQSDKINFEGKHAYIVSGGHGLIGREIVKSLIKNGADKVIIIGRSKVTNNQLLEWFNQYAEKIQYYNADIAESKEINKIHASIVQTGYDIKGIINCSGVFNNSFIINKNDKDVLDVLSPKIKGTVVLHNEFLNEKLDFFITFSSVAGVLGKMGQADYAYANSFLDNFNLYRESLRKEGLCSGKTICINWPFWSEGGMAIDDYEIDLMYEKLGAAPLTNQIGVEAFLKVLNSNAGSYTILYGKQEKLREVLENIQISNTYEDDVLVSYNSEDMINETHKWLIKLFEETFGINSNDLNSNIGFDELGIDSVGFNRLQVKLEKQLGSIKKTLLYETKNIGEIADYLLETMSDKLARMFCINKSSVSTSKANTLSKKKINVSRVANTEVKINQELKNDDIAVIGMSGRFPNATNCEELWDNLKNGIDCVSEIPKDRWDVDYYYCSDIKSLPEGKSYCKWGGFLSDVDKFDPQFFNMSPKEATMTDPQERLMLEVAWEVFEDAGYTKERLKEISDDNGNALVGTFISTASNTYNLIGIEQWERGNYIVPNTLPWSLSNRISYFMNFSAPSFTVDAACAGGIVALHQAINSLKNNECKMALVGGANLYLHPYKYVSLSQVKMLSKTGRCYTFSEKADGFVPGESVASVLLKPLKDAVSDNDRIYGVIKASAINHDANSNSYMAPNPKAQESLISNVINKAGISARDISYIEAHGTGTPIGDPIEVNALTNAFLRTTSDKQFCSIGSIKSNIGHSEGAAGIVGLIKVLLQMKHKTLVPSLHSEKLSEAIDFENSPFNVQRTLQEWNKPVVIENGERKECSRIAGISSFGAGGANGHVLVEEYDTKTSIYQEDKNQVFFIPISAKTQVQLQIYINSMYEHIMKHKESLKISSVAYTLQRCRNEMEYRVAFVASTLDDFSRLLKIYLKNTNNQCILTGVVKRTQGNVNVKIGTKINSIEVACNIAEKWVQGSTICWEDSLQVVPPIADLPTYPFAQKSFWVKKVNKALPVQHKEEDKVDDLEKVLKDIVNDEIDITKIINEIEKIDKIIK